MKIAVRGIELSWEEHGEGAPLLWLHGFMGCGDDWRYVFPEPPSGHRLIAPDCAGHGTSTERPGPYLFRESALDMWALLDHLHIDRVQVIGLSGGGITAMHMAVQQPERLPRMTVVSAPRRFPEQARAIQRVFSASTLGDTELARMRATHRREGQVEALLAQGRAFADSDDPDFSATDLGRITAQTLIVFGDRDPLYPVRAALDLREGIPRSYLWVVPNGGHGPIFGPMAAPFRAIVMPFFAGEWTAA